METRKNGGASATIVILALILALAGPGDVWASSSAFGHTVHVDWMAGTIRAEVELDLGVAGITLPSGRSQAERSLETAMPDLVRDNILAIDLDSYRTVGDSLADGSLNPAAFDAFLEAGRKTRSSLSRDLGRLKSSYEWRLADLAALYIKHSVPVDMPLPAGYTPSRAYTGILVFVQGEFDVHGEQRRSAIRPCLFPKLFDASMRVIVDRNLLLPEALREWGVVAYATSLDAPVVEARAGDAPLRILAAQIFGSRRGDVVLSAEDALKILGTPENRELARQGRIVFIIDEP